MKLQLGLPGIENVKFPPEPRETAPVLVTPTKKFGADLITSIPRHERFSSYVNYSSCTPDKVANVLRGTKHNSLKEFADLCDYMLETDAHIASLYNSRITTVEQAPVSIEAARSDDPMEQQMASKSAAFIDAVWENVKGLEQSLAQALSAVGYGHAVLEAILKREGNFWTIDRLEWAHLRRFTFGEDWSIRLYDNGAYGFTGKALDQGKVNRETMSIVLVHSSPARASYPDRQALFRVNVWNWCLKIWLTKFWTSAAERFGNPLLLAKVPPNAPPAVRSQAKEALENLSNDHAGVIEDPTSIEMLKGMLEGGSTFKDLMTFLDSRDSKAIVGSTLNTELGGVGSFAAAESQAERTIEPRAVSDSKRLASDIREQLFTPLLQLNTHLFGGVMPPVPHLRFQVVAEPRTDIQPWMLSVPGAFRLNEIRRQANLQELPAEEGGEEFIQQPSQHPGLPASGLDAPFSEPVPGGELADRPLSRPKRKMTLIELTKTLQTSSSSMNPLDSVSTGLSEGQQT